MAFLEVCLRLGNFLNKGTTYANAKGFSPSSLGQLASIKSSADKSTLLELLLSHLSEWAPEAGHLCEELRLVKSAGKQSVAALNEAVAEMRAGSSRVYSELEESPPIPVPPEVVEGSMQVKGRPVCAVSPRGRAFQCGGIVTIVAPWRRANFVKCGQTYV